MNKKKRLLSIATALSITASAFSGFLIPASAADTEYLNDNLDSYTATGINAQGTAGQSATLGNIALALGSRGSGGDNASIISMEKDGDNSFFKIVSGKYATSGRGASISFATAANIPAFAAIEDGNVLELSFDAKFADAASTIQIFGVTSNAEVGGGGVCNDPYLSVANNSQIATNEWLHVSVNVAKDKKGYATITDKDGKLVSAKSFTAVGDSLGKLAFYGAATTVYMDNIAVKQVANTYADLTVNVKTDGEANLEGATVKIGRAEAQTDASGNVAVSVPSGEYAIEASKLGYEATAGASDSAKATATMAGEAQTKNLVLTREVYTPVPGTVTIGGGQVVMTAPNSLDSVSSKAFTVDVLDQKDVVLESPEVVWSITPVDDNVSINESTGVVTVAKGFVAGDTHVKDFTVKASVSKNGTTLDKTTSLGISDYLFYEPGVNTASYGGTISKLVNEGTSVISIPTTATTSTMTFPDPIELSNGTVEIFKFDVRIDNKDLYTFARSIELKDSEGTSLVGKIFIDSGAMGLNGSFVGDSKTGYWDWPDGNFGAIAVNAWTPVSVLIKTNGLGEKTAKFTIGTQETTVNIDSEAVDIASIDFASAGTNADRIIGFKNIIIEKASATALELIGDTEVAKISGKEVTRTYKADPIILEEDETYTYSLKESKTGVEINATTGELTISDTAEPGKITIVTTSSISTSEAPKTAELEVDIKDFATVGTYNYVGPETIEVNSAGTYSVSDVVDQYNDKADMPVSYSIRQESTIKANVEFTGLTATSAVAIIASYNSADSTLKSVTTQDVTIENGACTVEAEIGAKVMLWNSLEGMQPVSTEVKTAIDTSEPIAQIDSQTGLLTLAQDAEGTFDVVASIGNPGKTTEAVKTVTVAKYSVIADATGNETVVSIAGLTLADSVSGFRVTTAKEGALVNQTEVAIPDGDTITVDTTDADKVEISPIYSFGASDNISVNGYTAKVPEGRYDITVKKAGTGRADVFVNGYLVGQNVDQSDDGKNSRTISEGALYTVEGIQTDGGKATVTMSSNDTNVSYVVIKKTPSIVDRKTHVYVLGDSLVANYYGEPTEKLENGEPAPGNARTGWGQVLHNFISGDIKVQNCAESGNYARGLYQSVFGSVIQNAEEGDFFILECGYNDANTKNNTSVEDMTYYIEAMINEAKAIGVTPIIVTPNASQHDYKAAVARTANLIEIAENNDVACVDLSGESYKFFSTNYTGDNVAVTVGRNYNVYVDENHFDTLHSSYGGAMLFASIVAQGISNLQETRTELNSLIINDDYHYTFTDTLGNTVNMQVNNITFTPKAATSAE